MKHGRIKIELLLDLEDDLDDLSSSKSFNYAMTEFDGAIAETTKIIYYTVDLNSFRVDD